MQVLGVDLHVLAIAEHFALDAHDAVFVGNEVVDDRRGGGEEVEIRAALRACWGFHFL